MIRRLLKSLRGLYDPLLVLLVVGAAGLLVYSLLHALGGGRGESICFDAAFDDVSGIKPRSSVLFKGMPVGTVGVIGPTRMAYERVIPIVDVTAKLISAALSQH